MTKPAERKKTSVGKWSSIISSYMSHDKAKRSEEKLKSVANIVNI